MCPLQSLSLSRSLSLYFVCVCVCVCVFGYVDVLVAAGKSMQQCLRLNLERQQNESAEYIKRTHTHTHFRTHRYTTTSSWHLSICKIHCHGNAMDKNSIHIHIHNGSIMGPTETRLWENEIWAPVQDTLFSLCVCVWVSVVCGASVGAQGCQNMLQLLRGSGSGWWPGSLPVHESVAGTKSVSHSAFQTDSHTDKRTDSHTDKRTNGQTGGRTDSHGPALVVSWQSAINTNSLTACPPSSQFPTSYSRLPSPKLFLPSNVFAHLPG